MALTNQTAANLLTISYSPEMSHFQTGTPGSTLARSRILAANTHQRRSAKEHLSQAARDLTIIQHSGFAKKEGLLVLAQALVRQDHQAHLQNRVQEEARQEQQEECEQ